MRPDENPSPSTLDHLSEAAESLLRFHSARGYYLKRNAVGFLVVFVWLTTLAGVYSFDLWLLTPILLGAIATWAFLRRQYPRFRDKTHYFIAVAVADNVFITAAVYAIGGAGSAGVQTVYTIPIFYHSLTRRRRQIYLLANMGAAMYALMMKLECLR